MRTWHEAGLGKQGIAARLGVSESAVVSYARRLGLSQPLPDTKRRNQRLVALFDQGTSIEALAENFALSPLTVAFLLRQEGRSTKQPLSPRSLDPEVLADIARSRRQGLTIGAISRRLRIPREWVGQIVCALGLQVPNAPTRQVILARVHAARERAGLTMAELCKRVGYRRASTELMVSGVGLMKYLPLIAQALGCDYDLLIESASYVAVSQEGKPAKSLR